MEPFHSQFKSAIFHLLQLLIFSLFLERSALGQCLQAESSALLQLKRSFTYNRLDTWLPGTDCCIWEGVTCDEFKRVSSLDLSNRSIVGAGTINPSLFNLTSLRILNFSHNNFYGISIPDFGWERLANLSKLDLSWTGFGGKVPIGISRLSKLTSLDLSTDGRLYLTINPTFFRNMSTLRELYFDTVNLSAYQNEWCGALVNSTPVLEVLSMNYCSLIGTGCSSLSMLPHLYIVNLGNNNLDSSIFDSFANLTSLSKLEVSNNGFEGYFPKQIFQLKSLKYLDISKNVMLSGSLPDFLDGSNLEILGLSRTNFSGNLPNTIGKLKLLKALYLDGCQFSGRIPPTIGNLTQLETLDLSYNNLSGDLELEVIKNLKNLRFLDLSDNGFSLASWDRYDGSSSSFFPNMSTLSLANCNLTKIPSLVKYQHKLTFLNLSRNQIYGEIPSYLWGIQSLVTLDQSYNLFTRVVEPTMNLSFQHPPYFVDLHSNLLEGTISHLLSLDIEILVLSNNLFTTFILSNLSSRPSTQILVLANNKMSGEITSSICNLTELNALDLSNNKLTGFIPPCLLGDIIGLELLDLGGNQLHGVIPHGISQWCDLQFISLSDNHLEGVLPRSLANCKFLEILDLGNNYLKGIFPYWLGNMPMLKILILRSNKFNVSVGQFDGNHKKNYTFTALQVFDISSNNFSGKLFKDCFSNFQSMMINRMEVEEYYIEDLMTAYDILYALMIMKKRQLMKFQKNWMIIKSIDISNNHFEGEIPTSIGQLVSLQVLNMSQNHLTGKIPWQLGTLAQLESLDLSMNSLSGNIPQELVSLHLLSSLNLSYNNLEGKVPLGGQFSTFPNTSFEGNEGLCYCFPYNTSVPKLNRTRTSSSSLDGNAQTKRSYMIVLRLLFGVGFGVCMATVVVLNVIYCDKGWRRRSGRPLHG